MAVHEYVFGEVGVPEIPACAGMTGVEDDRHALPAMTETLN
jgi:hypothetical protein